MQFAKGIRSDRFGMFFFYCYWRAVPRLPRKITTKFLPAPIGRTLKRHLTPCANRRR